MFFAILSRLAALSVRRVQLIASATVVLTSSATWLSAQPTTTPSEEQASSLETMRNLADRIQISLSSEKTALERIETPLFRFTDPARRFVDGSIWAWGKTGRPAALLVMASTEDNTWLVETVALSETPITHLADGNRRWTSQGPGLVMKPVPGLSSPNPSEPRRRIELKQISRRFAAHQMWDNDGNTQLQRYQLRLLPKPIHSYSDPERGILNGALYIFSYGANPEIVMALEAVQKNDVARWQCGFGRISWAAPHVKFDDHEVWQRPKIRGSSNTYLMSAMRAAP